MQSEVHSRPYFYATLLTGLWYRSRASAVVIISWAKSTLCWECRLKVHPEGEPTLLCLLRRTLTPDLPPWILEFCTPILQSILSNIRILQSIRSVGILVRGCGQTYARALACIGTCSRRCCRRSGVRPSPRGEVGQPTVPMAVYLTGVEGWVRGRG